MNCYQMVAALRRELRERLARTWTDYDLIQELNLGWERLATETLCLDGEVFFEALTGVTEYSVEAIAPDMLAIRTLAFRDLPMPHMTDHDRASLSAAGYRTESSFLSHFKLEQKTLVLYPIPSLPARYTAATVTTVQDSRAVAVTAGDPVVAGVKPGWIFGVGATPVKWYPILKVEAATVTLQIPFLEAAVVGSACVMSPGGMRLRYAAAAPKLRHFVGKSHYNTGTVDVTVDSAAVAGTATSWGLQINGSMQIGVGDAEPADGAPETRPQEWHDVLRRNSSTSITLSRPYRLETAAGKTYVLTDAAPYGREQWSLAAVYMAAAIALRQGDAKAEEVRAMEQRYEIEKQRVQHLAIQRGGKKTQSPARITLPRRAGRIW